MWLDKHIPARVSSQSQKMIPKKHHHSFIYSPNIHSNSGAQRAISSGLSAMAVWFTRSIIVSRIIPFLGWTLYILSDISQVSVGLISKPPNSIIFWIPRDDMSGFYNTPRRFEHFWVNSVPKCGFGKCLFILSWKFHQNTSFSNHLLLLCLWLACEVVIPQGLVHPTINSINTGPTTIGKLDPRFACSFIMGIQPLAVFRNRSNLSGSGVRT